MYTTMLIAVPTGVKVFNWAATMWRGSLTFETPCCTRSRSSSCSRSAGSRPDARDRPLRLQYHDTYFVVAHFHYVLVTRAVRDLRRGLLLLRSGPARLYDERLGKWHFWLSTIFVNILFFPQHFLGAGGDAAPDPGLRGAVRRLEHGVEHRRVRVRAHPAPVRVDRAEVLPGRKAATSEVWDGSDGLEWTLPSPAPYHTFETPPAGPIGTPLGRRSR